MKFSSPKRRGACSKPAPVETESQHVPPAHGPRIGEEPEGLTVSPDGKFVHVVFIPHVKHAWLNAEYEGSGLYAATGRGNLVFVVAAATNKPVTSFEVGQRPWASRNRPLGSHRPEPVAKG